LELLRSYKLSTNSEFGMGGLWAYYDYKLDDYWRLGCWYDGDNSLLRWKLLPGWHAVIVWPSTNFTGVWINYFANGQKFTQSNWKDGSRSGEQITFCSDGSKSGIAQFNHGIETSFSEFYPGGQIRSQGQYSNGTPVGIWIEFNQDGSTKHIETNHIADHTKP